MKISVIPATELDAALIEKWKVIQTGNSALQSPYYCPEFTQSVSQCGRDVKIAVMESAGGVSGFFPYEHDRRCQLQPVGGGLNDYHGAITALGLDWSPLQLLKAAGRRYFAFNHMPMSQAVFLPHIRFPHVSPVMELQGGWKQYGQRLAIAQNKSTPGIFAAVRYSTKRIEREVGPLRFEIRERNPAVLEAVMRLKAEQRVRMGSDGEDPFTQPWIRELLSNFFDRQDVSFRGSLCALYAGDKLVACHFGLQALGTLHYWFPVYETAYATYQPGLIMLMRLAEQGSQEGLDLIDLGRGLQDYKTRFCTKSVALGEGAVSRPPALASAVMAAQQIKGKIKSNPQVQRLRAWVAQRGMRVAPATR